MFESMDVLLQSRGTYYVIGVFVVALAVFATAARSPTPRCSRCHEVNRPMARFCAHCGQPLKKR